MLNRILNNQAILNLILNNERKHKHLVISDNEKNILEESLEILEFFYEITQRISVEQIGTSSVIIPSILFLKHVTKEDVDDSEFKSGFKEILSHYITFYDEKYSLTSNKNFILSSFLNPSFKKFSKANKEDQNKFIDISKEMIRTKLPQIKSSLKIPIPEQALNNTTAKKKAQLSDSSDDEDLELEITWRLAKKEIGAYIEESWALFEKQYDQLSEASNDNKQNS